MAAEGALTEAQVTCLEASLEDAASGFDQDRISLVLIADAHARAETELWTTRVVRHLEEIDDKNPGLALRYAMHLWMSESPDPAAVSDWALVALANRAAWTGEVYNERVFSAFKLRCAAAQTLWRQAEQVKSESDDEASAAAAAREKGSTRACAVDWYDFAAESGLDTRVPIQLCTLAGDPTRCGG